MVSKARIHCAGASGRVASQNLLGQNLEALQFAVEGMLAERLDNPKFLGPAHPQSGVAPGWDSSPTNRYSGFRLELSSGLGLSGNESQLIHVFHERTSGGILQTGRRIYRGERLEVALWARTQHAPATLEVGIRSLFGWRGAYDAKQFTVDSAYWKEYKVELSAPVDDDQAVFYCHVKGIGMVWLDQVHMAPVGSELNAPLIEEVKALKVPVLRFPGGCIAANYRWKLGTGPRHLRPHLPDPVFRWTMSYDFGCDEYLELCLDQGITPQIAVNVGNGTPAEAAEWAAHCREWFASRSIEPPPMYWQIGNEQWGDWEIGHMTPEMYADALRVYASLIRREYPNARIIALGVETGGDPIARKNVPWRAVILERAADCFDVLSTHRYHTGGGSKGDVRSFLRDLTGVGEAERMLSDALKDVRSRGLDKTVALTEWNLWYQAAHHDKKQFYEPYDVQHALFAAGMLHMFTRLAPGLELANFYHLVNSMGLFLVKGREVEVTPVADVFRFYRPGFPGRVVELRAEAPALPAKSHGLDLELPALDAVALENDEGTHLFVVNRHWDEAFAIEPGGFPGAPETALLEGESLRGTFRRRSGGALIVPPLSILRCTFS